MARTESEIDQIVTAQVSNDAAWEKPIRIERDGLVNEMRLLETGIRRTECRLREFEKTREMTTNDFVRRFENDELDETLEFAEWIGEYRLLQRLNEKIEALRTTRFPD